MKLFIAILLVCATFTTLVAAIPEWRAAARERIFGSQRKILAKVSGRISSEGPQIVVFKVQQDDALFLEIYEENASSGVVKLQKKIRLDERHDGYFSFQGNATNLVLADIDHSGSQEILAPTFDEEQTPRLNIFRYDAGMKTWEPMGPEN